MNPQFQQASFIPKKPLARSGKRRKGMSGKSVGIINGIALFVFVLALGASIAVFFYERNLNGKVASLEQKLTGAVEQLDLSFVEEVKLLDARLRVAEELLGDHIAASAVFRLLQEITLHRVQLTDVAITPSGAGAEAPTVTLTGRTSTFATLALQAEEIRSHSDITEATFDNIGLSEGGDVTFSASLTLDEKLIQYRTLFAPLEEATSTATSTPL